jgi:hypothetical protein
MRVTVTPDQIRVAFEAVKDMLNLFNNMLGVRYNGEDALLRA